ncbi:fimbrial biogenesis chaperone [Kangiella marina]|uniref:Pili assembly chaperone N-terminal domain-containing protein n=1 Tax=Kangiella marina TaxID=1079178 RepID=A0ABP8IHF9_9GAMM
MTQLVNTIYVTLLLLSVTAVNAAEQSSLQPQLAISPSRVVIEPEAVKGTQSVTVLNLGARPLQVEVSVQNWDFDEHNNYRALPPTPQSLDQWLIINPVRLTVPPKGQQTVRMAIRPKAKPEDGEHRAMVFFRQVPSAEAKGVNVQFNIGVPVYAFFGDVKREATLHSLAYDKTSQSLSFDITSSGNAYVRPGGYFFILEKSDDADGQILQRLNVETGEVKGDKPLASGKISSKPVFAGERRTVDVALPMNERPDSQLPEEYLLAIKVDVAGTLYEKVYRVQKDK